MKKAITAGIIFILFFTQLAFADDAAKKLGRGVANVATCWLELPLQVVRTAEKEGFISSLTTAVLKGAVFTAGRCLAGAYDIGTFLLPVPAGYKSIIQPEFVLGSQEGIYKGM